MCDMLNNGFVTGRFKRLPLLCSQYVPQDNKRVALSWGEPLFVVVHLFYNRRLWRVVLAVAACFIALFVLHYKCRRLQITFAIRRFVILY